MFPDPMQIDARSVGPEEGWEEAPEELEMGEGRPQRPVLRGNSINFRNIDGPRSLMVA